MIEKGEDYPIYDRQIAEHDRNHEHIDMGEREFTYRLTTDIKNPDAKAEEYNQPYYSLSFFPSGEGVSVSGSVVIDNKDVILSAYKKDKDGKLIVSVYNSVDRVSQCSLRAAGKEFVIELSPFEFRTLPVE